MISRFAGHWRRFVGLVTRSRDEIVLAVGWLAFAVMIGHAAIATVYAGENASRFWPAVLSFGALLVIGTFRYIRRRPRG